MRSYWIEQVAALVYKTDINGCGCSAALTTLHLSTKVGTKTGPPVAVAQSVYFTCGLKAMEFVWRGTKFTNTAAIYRRIVPDLDDRW
jgi:hypothetical protein